MYRLALLLLLACGTAPALSAPDCGTVPIDAGPPPFSCKPGQLFCAGSIVWSCTYTGGDAVAGQDCAQTVDGGYCSLESCDGGRHISAYCCSP